MRRFSCSTLVSLIRHSSLCNIQATELHHITNAFDPVSDPSAVPMHPDKTGCRIHVDYAVHVFEMPVSVILMALPLMVSLSVIQPGRPAVIGPVWKKMRIWECVTLFCIFMISPPHSSASTIQQQNQTPLPASVIRLADVTVQPCGQAKTNSKVQQDQKKTRGFPEGKSPLDPLSISPVKPKRNQKERQSRRIKGSQKSRTGAGSLQITTGQNGSFTEFRSGESTSVDPAEKSNNTNQQRVEISRATAHIIDTEKKPSGRTRTSKQGARTGFGLPVDRIGLGRLPSGRR
ncbi:hypothetical protein PGIGA_G00129380 [Pangasianodon gigas]|uniref:Uncharacterized protein n=1 Tax=Pangasianodon gigas TaxID=30993 RepID=A0ACC5XIT0_PANGG|nr:hypothetical protein [Pangasianodon gigas]